MKVYSNYYNTNLKQGAIPTLDTPSALGVQEMRNSQNFRERNYAGLCEKKNRGYNAAYSGSFTGKSEVAANVLNRGLSLGEKIMKSDWFAKSMGMINDHNIASSAFMALILAGLLRPATILSLPGKKDKEDKIYSSGHAVASGVIGFIASVILTSPLDAAVKKLFGTREILDEDGNVISTIKGYDEYGSKRLKQIAEDTKQLNSLERSLNEEKPQGKFTGVKKVFKKMTNKLPDWMPGAKRMKKLVQDPPKIDNIEQTLNIKKQKRLLKNSKNALKQISKNIPDWIIGIPRSMLTIALIPPILKYIFGVEKKKAQQPLPQYNWVQSNMKSFNEFKGGLK